MAEAEKLYWVRTAHGIVWGPYARAVLARLRGRLASASEVSVDGHSYRPIAELPELTRLLAGEEPEQPGAQGGAPAPAGPNGPILELPEDGDLERVSALRLYALAADSNAFGWLQLHTPDNQLIQISFRRGAPELVSSDDPELGVFRFLMDRKAITPEQALRAEEHRARSGLDAVSALFQLQLVPPSDAHRILGEHALFVLDRALSTWRGTFTFERDAPSPPGAFPLGGKWALLAEASRRLDAAVVRARLGPRLQRRAQKSGGNGVGHIEELGLTAQETRLWGAIDGTKTGEELVKSVPDQSLALRILHLLTELGHVSFAAEETRTASTPPPPMGKERPLPPRAPSQTPIPAQKTAPPRPASSQPPPARLGANPIITPPHDFPAVHKPPPRAAPAEGVAALEATRARLEKSNHFEALGLTRKSPPGDTRKAFFQLAREYHPDTVPENAPQEVRSLKESIFARINEAAAVLGDDARRKVYEAELDGQAQNVDVGNIFAAEEKFQRAEIIIKARKFAEGLALLEEAIKLNADEGEFYAWRGWARFMLAKERRSVHPEALADCKKALQMSPRCSPAWLLQGQMAKILGDIKGAENAFKKVLELDENNLEATRELRYLPMTKPKAK